MLKFKALASCEHQSLLVLVLSCIRRKEEVKAKNPFNQFSDLVKWTNIDDSDRKRGADATGWSAPDW